MPEGLRGYVTLANGLTEVSRRRAVETARSLLAQSPSAGDVLPRQVQQLADELIATARSNRELLRQMVAAEVLRAADALGLVRKADLVRLERRVDDLERRLEGGSDEVRPGTGSPAPASPRRSSKRQSAARTTAAGRTRTRKVAARTTTAKKADAPTVPEPGSPAEDGA